MQWSVWFWRISLSFSAVLFAFAFGVCVERFRIFPYSLINNANTALEAVVVAPLSSIDGPLAYKRSVAAPQTSWLQESGDRNQDLILMTRGSADFENLNPEGALAQLIDREGRVKHQWKYDPGLWGKLEKVTRVPKISGIIGPVALHLFDNGDLLVSYHGFNTFPYSVGLAKFDKDSKLLWKRENLCHHCFSVTQDGRIYAPSMEIAEGSVPIGKTACAIVSPTTKIYRDVILELDSNGEELSRLDVMDALADSGWGGQFIRGNKVVLETDDPIHLNDVRIIGPKFAANHDWLAPTDLLISLRNLNCIAILDFQTAKIKWISCGAAIGQHSPRVFKDSILALDNLGGDEKLGGTRLVKIDLDRGIPSTLFPRHAEDLPDSMRTINSGYLDVSDDENRVLVSVTHAGTIWEVDIESGKVLWEYIDGYNAGHDRLKIGFAKYVSQPSFIHQD